MRPVDSGGDELLDGFGALLADGGVDVEVEDAAVAGERGAHQAAAGLAVDLCAGQRAASSRQRLLDGVPVAGGGRGDEIGGHCVELGRCGGFEVGVRWMVGGMSEGGEEEF